MFYRPFRDATKVIGVSPVKNHNLCKATVSLKNWYGLLGNRAISSIKTSMESSAISP